MAPLRRYLRITKYSVLECRIYLDNPALAQSWLLNPRDPVLLRVIDSVRPLVLPKLREERERSRKKSTKKRGIKDTVTEDDFEVSIFLTETSTRHSLLYKHKHFRDTTQTKLTSTSNKLTGASREAPVDVDADAAAAEPPAIILREEDADDDADKVALHNIPAVGDSSDETAAAGTAASASISSTRASKRRRSAASTAQAGAENVAEITLTSDEDDDADDADGLFVDSDGSEASGKTGRRPAKRRRYVDASMADANAAEDGTKGRDDKKKLAMDISYEGFAIYGRVLCLVVKRRGDGTGAGPQGRKGVATAGGSDSGGRGRAGAPLAGQAGMMESWISSTQMPAGD
ncbi:unnamed protein product [Discula destructiva]